MGSLGTVVALWAACEALPYIAPAWVDLAAVLLRQQDRWLLLAAVGASAVAVLDLRPRSLPFTLPAWLFWAMAGIVGIVCLAGHRWVLASYDLSRDEQMANFDAQVFAEGLLAQPLRPPWQAHAGALNTLFMLPARQPVAWISDYLPMNAALRALVGCVAAPALTGPLLSGAGLLLLCGCARRLWPHDREAAIVAALLYVGSGQMLFAGMTSYAMPAHLTLDLLWLRLFLMDRRGPDIGASLVAFIATGLHQPLFHPLFALPFLVGLVRFRRWDRVALYGFGYVSTSCFWIAWPIEMQSIVLGGASPASAAGADHLTRMIQTLARGEAQRWSDMAANLLRFAAWQHLLLLPLMAAGAVLGRRERPTLALAASVGLPVMAMTVLLPYQGHGFGYRYLHGVIGPAILLAVEGWRCLARRNDRLRPLLLQSTAAGLAVVLPLQAVMAHGLYAPYARADALIRTSGADYAVVGPDDAPFARDLVLNRPDLSNRPIRLLADEVPERLAATLCGSGARVAVATGELYAPIQAWFGKPPTDAADRHLAALSAKFRAAGCTVGRIGDP